MPRERILIVEDEGIVQLHLRRIVEAAGFQVTGLARSGEDALASAARERPDLVLMDIRLAGALDGIETALRLRAEYEPALIFITAHADETTLARAGKAVPMGYVVKPFEADDVRAAIATALAQRAALQGLSAEPSGHPASAGRRVKGESAPPYCGMVGEGPAFEQLVRQLGEIARGDWTVVIEGETGTGKELAARAIHQLSGRAKGPFVAINCGALTESLAGSQLFGHKQGAFTGAVRDHQGFFEAAHGGTLFLDEVAELPATIQASLLRVLEDRSVMQLGSSKPRQLDFRLLVATNKDLCELAKSGTFRQDLLYRLRVARVRVPPLRERRDDLEGLVRFFLEQAGRREQRPAATLTTEALRRLRAYGWPGNVRELKSALEYAAIRSSGGRIEASDLPPEISGAEPQGHGPAAPGGLEEALRLAQGNHTLAAKRLGISRATFYRRLARLSGPADC